MKKFFLFGAMMVVLSIVFFACTTEEPPIDDDGDDPIVVEETYTHDIDASNVESFFDLSVTIEEMNGVFIVTADAEQSFDGEVEDANVSLVVYVDATFKNEQKLVTQNIFIDIVDTKNSKIVMLNQSILEAELFYVVVDSANGSVETTQTIHVVDKTYTVPEYVIEEDENIIVIDDPEQNAANYQALMTDIADFYMMLAGDIEYLQVDVMNNNTTMTGGYYEETTSTYEFKAKNDESYVEVTFDDQTSVYQYAHDRYFVYEFEKGQYSINPYVMHVENSIYDDIDYISVILGNYFFDPETMLFTETDKGYHIEAYLADAVGEDAFMQVAIAMASIGFTEDEINKFKIDIEYEMDDVSITQIERLIMVHDGEDFKLTSRSSVEQSMSIEAFVPIDFTDDAYTITPADELDEVVETTDFSVPMVGYNNPRHYAYLTHLEPGQYVVNNPESNIRINVYDELGNQVYLNDVPNYYVINPNGLGYLFVDEASNYYIEMYGTSSNTSDGYTFSLDLLDYETILDLDNPDPLMEGTYTFNSEGEHDFALLTYDVNEPVMVKFTPNMDTNVTILYDGASYNNYENWGIDDMYITIHPEASQIVLYAYGEKTVDLAIEMVDTSHYVTDDLEMMAEITEALSVHPIYTSEALGDRYLKLIVEEKAYYTIHYEMLDGISTPAAHIYDEDGNMPDYNVIRDNYGVVLEPGTYYVAFNASRPSAGYVRYEKIVYEAEMELTLTLEETETLNRFDDSFPEPTPIVFFDEFQLYRAWFTLTEPEVVIICDYDWQLFTAEGEPVGIYYTDLYDPDIYLSLDAGTYYIEKYNAEVGYQWTTSIRAAIYTGELEDDYVYGSTIPVLPVNEAVTVVKNNSYDTELFQLTLEEETSFYSNYYQTLAMEVYDEQGQFVTTFYNYDNFTLDSGTYYIYMSFHNFSDDSLTFTLETTS